MRSGGVFPAVLLVIVLALVLMLVPPPAFKDAERERKHEHDCEVLDAYCVPEALTPSSSLR